MTENIWLMPAWRFGQADNTTKEISEWSESTAWSPSWMNHSDRDRQAWLIYSHPFVSPPLKFLSLLCSFHDFIFICWILFDFNTNPQEPIRLKGNSVTALTVNSKTYYINFLQYFEIRNVFLFRVLEFVFDKCIKKNQTQKAVL